MTSTAIDTLRADMRERPQVFYWYGPIARESLQQWIELRQLDVPGDLLDVWLSYGGGVMFESEEVLAPLGGDEHALDFDEVNYRHRDKGLPDGLVVFHEGTWVSAVRNDPPRYVAVAHSSYETVGEFESFDAWYRSTVREEFAERYGLRIS